MTLQDLVTVLESRNFKSTFKHREEHPIFSFRDGFVKRDGVKFGKYKIAKQGDNFTISFSDTELGLFTGVFRNIIIAVQDDDRFPISLNFSLGSDDIIMEAENT